MHRRGTINITDNPTATAHAIAVSDIDACTAAPIKADRTVPISTGHGCESGLAGMPKSKTALAASEDAIHILFASPPHQRESNPVTSSPKAMPTDMRNASAYPTRTDAGKKFLSHSPQRLSCARLASKVFAEFAEERSEERRV